MNRRIPGLVVLLTLGLVLSACETNPLTGRPKNPFRSDSNNNPSTSSEDLDSSSFGVGLTPAPSKRFDDIPIPSGVRENKDETFVFESSEIQVARMVYTTRATANELAQFYIDECPRYGWNLDQVVQGGGTKVMLSKPTKRLSVEIQDLGFASGRKLVINLTPAGG